MADDLAERLVTLTDATREDIEVLPSAARRSALDRALETVAARPVLTVVIIAALARLVTALVFTIVSGDAGTFYDDVTYSTMASNAASGATETWTDYEHWLYDTTSTFMVPLTAAYRLFGDDAIVGRLVVASFGTIAAGATAWIATRIATPRLALVAGGIVALLPSQVLFSSLVLKDAAVWAVLACLAAVAVACAKADGHRLVLLLVVAAGFLFLLANLRHHTFVVATWSFMFAALVAGGRDKLVRIAGVAAILVVLPMTEGLGAGGMAFVADQEGTLQAKREANAALADTAFVEQRTTTTTTTTMTTATTTSSPAEGGGAVPPTTASPEEESGPSSVDGPGSVGTDVRALPRGLFAMLLEPAPWQSSGNVRVELARAESALVWWPCLLVALVGLWTAIRRRMVLLAFPIAVGAGVLGLYALSEGNFGTAYRHRGEIVWVVALLAAVGVPVLVTSVRSLRGQPSR